MSRQLLDELPQSFCDTFSRPGAMLDRVLVAVFPLHCSLLECGRGAYKGLLACSNH